MTRLLLASVTAAFFITGAFAQQATPPMPGMGPMMDMKGMEKRMAPNADDSASTKAYKAASMKMMDAMPKFTGDADVDFMTQMRAHHQGAIDMAKVLLANGKDAETRKLAQEIIVAQEKEIAMIDVWLKKKGT